MLVPHTVPISGKPGVFAHSGAAWSRMRWDAVRGVWVRAWYLTHEECMTDRHGRGEPREDVVDSRAGDGPPVRAWVRR